MRNAVLLCVFIISSATTAFGDEVWYYTLPYSGYYTATENIYDNLFPFGNLIFSQSDRGSCNTGMGLAFVDCSTNGSGGEAYFGFALGRSSTNILTASGEVRFDLRGELFISGTGTTDAVFDWTYGYQAVSMRSPTFGFNIDGTIVSDVFTTSWQYYYIDLERGSFSEVVVTNVQRGVPVPFEILFNDQFRAQTWPTEPSQLDMFFSLNSVDGITGTPGYFAPEPSTAIAVCFGIIAIAAGVRRKRLHDR